MPWTIDTFAGLKANAAVDSNWRVAGFELFRALNERQAALALGKTEWMLPDGSDEFDVTYAELEGTMNTQGGAYPKVNLIRLQAGIVTMVNLGRFTVASGRGATYTLASLESAIGSSLTSAPTGPCDARFWQAQRDALDLLIYGRSSVAASTNTTGLAQGLRATAVVLGLDTLEAAWAAGISDLAVDPDLTFPNVTRWNMVSGTFGSGDGGSNVTLNVPTSCKYPAGSFGGVLIDVDFSVAAGYLVNGGRLTFTGVLDYSIGSASINITAFTPLAPLEKIFTAPGSASDIPSFGAGGLVIVPLACTPPDTCPFSFIAGAANDSSITVRPYSATYFHDIASVLTDQA